MQPIQLANVLLFTALLTPGVAIAQPVFHNRDTVDWLVVDSDEIIRCRVVEMKPVAGHDQVSRVVLEVLESVRDNLPKQAMFLVETKREAYWLKPAMESKRPYLLFFTKEPRGYTEPFVQAASMSHWEKRFLRARIDLSKPDGVMDLERRPLKSEKEILDRVRMLVMEAGPKPKPFTFQTWTEFITVPLNTRMETIAKRWATSNDGEQRRIGQTIIWGFKRLRNKPFEGGYWYARLKSPGGPLRFGIRLDRDEQQIPYALIINGSEVLTVKKITLTEDALRIEFPHYDSSIAAVLDRETQTMNGVWRKVASQGKVSELPFVASMKSDRANADESRVADFYSRWRVKFSSTDDPAVGVFDTHYGSTATFMDVRQYEGTFMTTTGDYRYLAGDVFDGRLELSVFDGAHAFLFHGRLNDDGRLVGDFWSRDNWHESWTAVRDEGAKLPDAFEQTRWTGDAKLADLRFPDLKGNMKSLADREFSGKVRIITVFGSWCPNCHDSALYLAKLHKRYANKGLSIVGLAFELTGDFERDAKQVQRYVDRHKTPYPILLAGLADKKKASQKLPILDRVRSYPTTIFLNAKNEVISIHTGFTGPATGEAYDELRRQFEAIIEQQLKL